MAKNWIFIGDHNLRGEAQGSNRSHEAPVRGELIEPFVPFDCSQQWRNSFRKNPRVDRQIMTVDEYEARLNTYTLAQLFNETRRRVVSNEPVNVRDAANVLRPSRVLEQMREAALRATEDNEQVSEWARRYGLSDLRIADAAPELARIEIVRAAIAYILRTTGKTEGEIRAQLVAGLMKDIRAAQREPQKPEPRPQAKPKVVPADLTVEERRERVAEMMTQGLTQMAMAEALNVSRSTIQLDVSSLRESQHGG